MDQAAGFGDRDEHVGPHGAAGPSRPAQQGLDRHHGVAGGIDDGLVKDVKGPILEAAAHVVLDVLLPLPFGIQFRAINLDAGPCHWP